MSIQRKPPREIPKEIPREGEEIIVTSTQIQPLPEPPNLTIQQQKMSRLWGQIMSMKSEKLQEAEDKYQLSLMFATLNEICQALTDFMTVTENQLKVMNEQQTTLNLQANERQTRFLSLQKRYVAEVQGEIENIYRKSYYVMQENQKEVFDQYEKHIAEKLAKFEKSVENATAKSNQSAKRVETVNEKLFKVKKAWDLMQYAAPVAVLLNLIFRVFQHFSGG